MKSVPKHSIPRWEAYAVLFQKIRQLNDWSRPQLIDALNQDGANQKPKCDYSVRTIDAYQTIPKKGSSRNPKWYKERHLHEFFTRQLDKHGVLKNFRRELTALAPTQHIFPPNPSSVRLKTNNKDSKLSTYFPVPVSEPPASEEDEKYAKTICARFGHVLLESLNLGGSAYLPIRLKNVFVPQSVRKFQDFLQPILECSKERIAFLKSPACWANENISLNGEDLARRRYLEQQPSDVLQVLANQDNRKIVFLGSLGAGKTSLIRFQAIRWADGSPEERKQYRFPLVIDLKHYANTHSKIVGPFNYINYLCQGPGSLWQFSSEGLKQRLLDGNITVYFDGLDEIFDQTLCEEAVIGIIRFATEYPHAQIVVFSRLLGFHEYGLRGSGFTYFVIEDFAESQISSFIQKWIFETSLQKMSEADIEWNTRAIIKYLDDADSIAELASNPLFLTIILSLRHNNIFPTNRVELIRQCSHVLLKQWKVDEALRADPDLKLDAGALDIEQKKRILREIAGRMAKGAKYPVNTISSEDIQDCIVKCVKNLISGNPWSVARAIIKQLRERNGILRLDGANSYAFNHPVFAEYFYAEHLHSHVKSGKVSEAKVIRDLSNKISFFGGWRDVLAIYCGIIGYKKTINALRSLYGNRLSSQDNVFAVAECLKYGALPNKCEDPFVNQIKDLLINSAKTPFPSVNQIREMLTNSAKTPFASCEVIPPTIRRSVDYLTELFPNDEIVGSNLLKIAVAQPMNYSTQFVTDALVRGWRHHKMLRQWMETLIMNAENEFVQEQTVKTLADLWPDNQTLIFLKKAVHTSNSPWVKYSAIDSIARQWNRDPSILKWLKEIFILENSSKEGQAGIVVGAIAKYFYHDSSVFSWLKKNAFNHSNWGVRLDVVFNIGKFKDQEDVKAVLCHYAKKGEHHNIRSAACRELREYYSGHPEIQLFFEQILVADSDASVRCEALHCLDAKWKSAPKNVPLLLSLIKPDVDVVLRITAIDVLREFWRGDPTVAPILNKIESIEHREMESE